MSTASVSTAGTGPPECTAVVSPCSRLVWNIVVDFTVLVKSSQVAATAPQQPRLAITVPPSRAHGITEMSPGFGDQRQRHEALLWRYRCRKLKNNIPSPPSLSPQPASVCKRR